MSKISELMCAVRGHDWVTGRVFMDSDGNAYDYKWRACVRCQKWVPEGGIDHFLWERGPAAPKTSDAGEQR